MSNVITPSETDTPNANIIRWARGEYDYLGLTDGRPRGQEWFHLTVHPDNSRTMRATTDIYSRDVQLNCIQRVADSFRPIEAYVTLFTQQQYKGGGLFWVDGTTLRAVVNDSTGHVEDSIEVPEHVSLGTHPISMDGWHSWYLTPEENIKQDAHIYFLIGAPNFNKPFLGKLQKHPMTYLGRESVTTSAGTFDTCIHLKMGNHSEMWVMEQDRLVVRYDWHPADRRYELRKLETG